MDCFSESLNYSKNLIYGKILNTEIDTQILVPLKVKSQSQLHDKNYPFNVTPLDMIIEKNEIQLVEQEFSNFDFCDIKDPNTQDNTYFQNQKMLADQSELINFNDIENIGGNFFKESPSKNFEISDSANKQMRGGKQYSKHVDSYMLQEIQNQPFLLAQHSDTNKNLYKQNNYHQNMIPDEKDIFTENNQANVYRKSPASKGFEQEDTEHSKKYKTNAGNVLDRFVGKKEGNINVDAFFHPRESYSNKINSKN